jgi:hypothetical protein
VGGHPRGPGEDRTVSDLDGKGRDDYTWQDATKDLALATRLTIREAFQVTFAVRDAGVHPYDAVPHLVHLFGEKPIETRALGLEKLLGLRSQGSGGD